MRSDFVVREVVTGLRRNVTMTIAMVLTTAISLGLVGTGLLAVRTIDRTEQLYSDRVEVQVALTSDVSANDTNCSQPICAGLKATLENSPLVASSSHLAPQVRHAHESSRSEARYSRSTSNELQYGHWKCSASSPNVGFPLDRYRERYRTTL